MIILIGGQKGGTGKSTLATNLAAWFANNGTDIVLVDGNPTQGTARKWIDRRNELIEAESDPDYKDQKLNLKPIECVEKSVELKKTLKDLQSRYEVVLVDTGGQDSKEFRSSLLVSNLVITPVGASPADIETLDTVVELVTNAKIFNESLIIKAIISKAPTHSKVTLTEETIELIEANFPELELMKAKTHLRNAYVYASGIGAGVTEIYPVKDKAYQEIEVFTKELFDNGEEI
ncbi:AAA family ATPase [Thiomicrorhabdus hydrogeniphila]